MTRDRIVELRQLIREKQNSPVMGQSQARYFVLTCSELTELLDAYVQAQGNVPWDGGVRA